MPTHPHAHNTVSAREYRATGTAPRPGDGPDGPARPRPATTPAAFSASPAHRRPHRAGPPRAGALFTASPVAARGYDRRPRIAADAGQGGERRRIAPAPARFTAPDVGGDPTMHHRSAGQHTRTGAQVATAGDRAARHAVAGAVAGTVAAATPRSPGQRPARRAPGGRGRAGRVGRGEFAVSSLDTARRAFRLLVTGPNPLSVDGREFPGLPPRRVALDELSEVLLRRDCPRRTRDAVWAHLVRRSRAEGGAWTLGCVGVALPALTRVAATVSARFAGDTADLDTAVLTGFLGHLAEIDLDEALVMTRLRWAAYREGLRAVREALDAPSPRAPEWVSVPPPPPYGHPDLVLAQAVAEKVITAADAELIGLTRLQEVRMLDAAAQLGNTYHGARRARIRAEARLVAWLRERTGQPAHPVDPESRAVATDTHTRNARAAGEATRAATEQHSGAEHHTDAEPTDPHPRPTARRVDPARAGAPVRRAFSPRTDRYRATRRPQSSPAPGTAVRVNPQIDDDGLFQKRPKSGVRGRRTPAPADTPTRRPEAPRCV